MNQTEKINQQLYEKLSQEYSRFIDGLKQLSPEEIIEHSYEKVFKEDILTCFECDDMPYAKAKALLSLKNPLNDLYEEWLSTDCTHMDMLRDCINDRAISALKELKSKSLKER